ncbi:U-box domain-containing protein 33 [Apostasia shenzhenica]|uniref:U-box domain-containing protein 33 n=1 Tax=Apostasia shenzhenica TaxID=1088818 RepID=A0A2I0A0T1_9ASPA|nr:U-box domain-containing protein 33 [Apostasia shenzhenica]
MRGREGEREREREDLVGISFLAAGSAGSRRRKREQMDGRISTVSDREWEIEEVEDELIDGESAPSRIAGGSLGSHRLAEDAGEEVYVAVGKNGSSMGALAWALKHSTTPSAVVYLIHVFPEVNHIPTPLGMLPKNQVTPQQVETYREQERDKRRELLQKYINRCRTSNVQGETLLIESDLIAKAIIDLIPVLNIKRLIVGTTKSNLIRNGKMKRTCKADQICKNAPQFCEVKIICEGREVIAEGQSLAPPYSSPVSSNSNRNIKKNNNNVHKNKDNSHCIWFPIKFCRSI